MNAIKNAGLAEAWTAVEVVLPEWWRIRSLTEVALDEWEAVAFEHNRIQVGYGETPEAALLSLAGRFSIPPVSAPRRERTSAGVRDE